MKREFDWNMMPYGAAYCRIESDEQGQVRYILEECNEAFSALISRDSKIQDLSGREVVEFISVGDRERFLQYVQDIKAAQGKVCAIECNVTGDEGEAKPVYWKGNLIQFGDEEIILLSTVEFGHYIKERKMLLEAVHANQAHAQKVEDIIKQMSVGATVFEENKGFHVIEGNTAFFKIVGYSKTEMIGQQMDLFDLIVPVDRESLRAVIEESREKGKSKQVEVKIRRKDGELRCVVLQSGLFRKMDDKFYFNIILWDITERKVLEDELRLLNEQYTLLQEISNEVPMEYDVAQRRYKIPVRFKDSLDGETVQYVSQEQAIQQMHPDDTEAYLKAYEEASRHEIQGSIEFRIHMKAAPEEWLWRRTIYKSMVGPDKKIVRIIGKTYDVSADKLRQQQLTAEARLDQQTRLLNKIETQRLVDEYLAQNEPGAHVLFVIDIDHFKKINDTFGHTIGDTIIADMSHKIRESFRNTDIVGRIGGDEFVVFMKATTESFARKKAELLCKNAQKVIYGGAEKLQVTVSVGGAVYGKDGTTYAELFDSADEAMYTVKTAGRDGFRFRNAQKEELQSKERAKPNAIVANGENVDRELLNMAFNLLSHAKDMDLSLNLLLEQIGKRFELNMVSVFVQDVKKAQMVMTNCWSDLDKIYERDMLPRTWKFFENEPNGVFVELYESMQEGRAEMAGWDWNKIPVRNMGAVKFEISSGSVGELNIGTAKEDARWTENEIETICELSRIVSVFVSLRNRAIEDKQLIHELRHRERLTGLYDKDTFKAKVETIMKVRAASYYYAVAVMDINNFAYINENFGTEVGDKILCDLADLLDNSEARTKFSSRMYSDCFATFISAPTHADVIGIVTSGTKAFEERLNEKYPMGRVSLSVGICFINTPEEYESIMENANIARKYAKEHGITNGIVFDSYMRHKRDELVEVSSKFNDAVLNEEFEVYLQPKFLIKEWKAYGAEALVRWRQADGTVISPARFIPSLEMTGQIVELDFIIFEKVLSAMRSWMDRGLKMVTVSTNFSRRHFEQNGPGFVKRIQKLVDYYRVPAEYIEIEITESVVVDNINILRKNMEELKKIGFRIAIDDFGTGYSSLNVLLEIPANVIKMDKTFTDKLHLEKQRRFVAKMGMLIKAARQEVLFEGVETEEQLNYLRASGFEFGQGYLFDKPIPIEEFEQKYL
ncbi:MAG: EAL domain-containing protein [Roseburia sp.]|nr:EAL domain-containing protein [Roseburia sp.]